MNIENGMFGFDFILGYNTFFGRKSLYGIEYQCDFVGGHTTLMDMHTGNTKEQLMVLEGLYKLIHALPRKERKDLVASEKPLEPICDHNVYSQLALALYNYGKDNDDLGKILEAKTVYEQLIQLYEDGVFPYDIMYNKALQQILTINTLHDCDLLDLPQSKQYQPADEHKTQNVVSHSA